MKFSYRTEGTAFIIDMAGQYEKRIEPTADSDKESIRKYVEGIVNFGNSTLENNGR